MPYDPEYAKEYRRKNADKIKAGQKAYAAKNAERKADATRQWRIDNPEKARALDVRRRADPAVRAKRKTYNETYCLKSRYGISVKDRDDLIKKQKGRCAICSRKVSVNNGGKRDGAAVDHCHKTGDIRGILCNHCNRAIGLLGDSVSVLSKALAYLKKGGL